MKICRFDHDRLGVIRDGFVLDVTPALQALPAAQYPFPRHDALVAHLDSIRTRILELLPSANAIPIEHVRLLSPIANPGKVIAAPVNYRKHLDEARASADIHHGAHVEEIQRIGLFLKATSSLVGASEGVALQHLDRRNDHEVELAVVIGKAGRNIARADAFEHIAGYAIGLDMTVRGPQERSLRKSVDSFTVLGPWLSTPDEVADASALDIWLAVNDEPRQRANTRDLVLGIAELIEFASSYYSLHPGDILLTGTPDGVGPVVPGDRISCGIEGLGRMDVAVRGAADANPATAATPVPLAEVAQ